MAKPISITYKDNVSNFALTKLARSKLYGSRKRLALDSTDQVCSRCQLSEDGTILIRKGMTSQGYFTSDNTWIPNNKMVGLDSEGKQLELVPSTLGVPQEVIEPCSPEELLDIKPTTVYMLDPIDLGDDFKLLLGEGEIFKFPLNYRADYQAERAFILKNSEGYFCIVGNDAPTEWCIQEKPTLEVTDDQDEDDDLDFDMF